VNYRDYATQISRTFSFCITEAMYPLANTSYCPIFSLDELTEYCTNEISQTQKETTTLILILRHPK
jgi:hypothetical protein